MKYNEINIVTQNLCWKWIYELSEYVVSPDPGETNLVFIKEERKH